MGQCNLTDLHKSCGGDMLGDKDTDDTNLLSRESFTEKDRMLWEH